MRIDESSGDSLPQGRFMSREQGRNTGMAGQTSAAVAASSEWVDETGTRQPGGDAHAWMPGTNQTVCGVPLSRARLRRFPHVPFDFRATDVVTAADEIRHICPRCLAGTGARRAERPWKRVSPRP
jgi:hypothetical protein